MNSETLPPHPQRTTPRCARAPALLRLQAAQIDDDGVEVVAADVLVVAVRHGRLEPLAAGAHTLGDRLLDVAVEPGAEVGRRDVARDRGAPGTVEAHAAGAEVVDEVGRAVGAGRGMALDAMAERTGEGGAVGDLVGLRRRHTG